MTSGWYFTGGGGKRLQLYSVKSLIIQLMGKNYYSSYLDLSFFFFFFNGSVDTNSRELILATSVCEALSKNIPMPKILKGNKVGGNYNQ